MVCVCVSRLSSAKPPAAVIMEGRKLSEDEEDDEELFVVEETVPPPPDMPEMEPVGAASRVTGAGHLLLGRVTSFFDTPHWNLLMVASFFH